MELKINFSVLFILKLVFLLSTTNGYELSRINDTRLVKQQSASDYPNNYCSNSYAYNQCGSYTNMICQNEKCVCRSGFEWDYGKLKCMKICDYYTSCISFDYNRHCSSGQCVCDSEYEESDYSDQCKKKPGCTYDYNCGTLMVCENSKCVCMSGYSLSSSGTYCTYDYSVSWVYYLWFLLLIPIAIIVASVWCICRRRVTAPGAVIVSNSGVIGQPYSQSYGQSYGQPQQYTAPPPSYSESNTYRY